MRIRSSLRLRVTVAILATVVVICGLLAAIILLFNGQLKSQFLDAGMARELNEYQHAYALNPKIVPPTTASLDSYLVDTPNSQALPAPFRGLSPGQHNEIEYQGRSYHVGVRRIDGKTLVLAQDITSIENREILFGAAVALGLLIAVVAAVWIGIWMARIVIAPVNRLADRLQSLPPERRSPHLAREFAEHEVGVIARAFDQYAARLDAFIARERSFTEDASHELRTPLTVLYNALEVLEDNRQRPPYEARVIERIRRTLTRMSNLIDALLFLAREPVASGRSPQTGLGEVIEDCVASYRPLLKSHTLVVEQDIVDPITVAAPSAAVEIVVGNLLRNAIEHGGRGPIRVVLRGGELSVEDAGAGIPEAQRGQLFTHHRAGGGTGIGLYLVRRVCERYGWHVTVASGPDRGARFTVHFNESG